MLFWLIFNWLFIFSNEFQWFPLISKKFHGRQLAVDRRVGVDGQPTRDEKANTKENLPLQDEKTKKPAQDEKKAM